MKPGKIKKILRKELNKVIDTGQDIGEDYDKDIIHDFRVEVKTLRSFLRLLRTNSNNSNLKLTAKFKRQYHICGAIRDAQLELKNITDARLVFPVYMDSLQQKMQQKKGEWRLYYAKKTFQKLEKKLTCHHFQPLEPIMLTIFINGKMDVIRQLCQLPSLTNDQVHNMRKAIKDILYIVKLAKKNWKAGYIQTGPLDVEPLENLATVIGDYNDSRIMHDHLISFCSKNMSNEEKSAISNFCNEEARRLNSRKKNALTLVRKYIHTQRNVNL